MKTITKWLAACTGIVLFILFLACRKENSVGSGANIPPGKSQLSVYMMDDPIQMTKVLIDIRQVAILIDTASKQDDPDEEDEWDDDFSGHHHDRDHRSVIWDTLKIKPGVYDLLKLRNGTDTLLGSVIYPNGKILKVRITLGSDNSIYTDSVTSYPLVVFGPHPYFTINVRREDVSEVTNNQFKLWLDFNLSKSIFFWNGEFLLRPNIIVFNDEMEARIKGLVLPEHGAELVTASNSADTLYAIPNEDGWYLLRGVPAGTYSINFKGKNDLQDTTISNIVVHDGKLTNSPTVRLHP